MPSEVSQLLIRWQSGDSSALNRLMPLVYDELRKLGRAHFRRQPNVSVLQPTALVHEAWLRLAAKQDVPVHCRGEFFALASRVMRGLLVDHLRRQRAAKRRGSQIEISFEEVGAGEQSGVLDVLVLNDALTRLTGIKPRYTQVVEMRIFGGLTIQEIADALLISRATVEREWSFARLWLMRDLRQRQTDRGEPKSGK